MLGLSPGRQGALLRHVFEWESVTRIDGRRNRSTSDFTQVAADKVVAPQAALKKARMCHLSMVTVVSAWDPIEVQKGIGDGAPLVSKPSRMKPRFPGLSAKEAFLLQIAV